VAGVAAIGIEAGKVISRYKTGKHFRITITDDSLTQTRITSPTGRNFGLPKDRAVGALLAVRPLDPRVRGNCRYRGIFRISNWSLARYPRLTT
jgi:hypothetical protein